jgi:predicted GTPase
MTYHPGEVNVRCADIIVINKVDTATKENIAIVEENIKKLNPTAKVIHAASPVSVENPSAIKGKKVLVVEDGPTLTHGEMKYGAATIAAQKYGGIIVEPRPYVVKSIKETFKKYPHIGVLLPAMGYSDEQIKDLQETINKVPCDLVLIGTPIDLAKLIKINKPSQRVNYSLDEQDVKLDGFLEKLVKPK